MQEERDDVDPTSLKVLGLDRRETEIFALVTSGRSNTEIALRLGLKILTVNRRLEEIYRKLNVETRSAAARVALAASCGQVSRA